MPGGGDPFRAVYGRQMTGDRPSYRERQKGRVQCRECGDKMAEGSLARHRMTHYGRAAEERRSWKNSATGEEPRTYCMAFPAKGFPRVCPVEGCPGRAATRTSMQVHFLHPHIVETVVILEEGKLPHPRCPQCGMLVFWGKLNRRHPATAQCARGSERKRRRLAEAELRESTERAFEAC